jgi:hypothetical protein
VLPLKINNEASNWPLGDAVLEGQNLLKMVVVGLSLGVAQQLWFPWSNAETITPRRGLLDEEGEVTPQYLAFQNLSQRLDGGFRFASHDTLGSHVLRYDFRRDSEPAPMLAAMWWDDGAHGRGVEVVTIALPQDVVWVIRYEYDGASSVLPASGFVTLSIGDGGILLEYLTPATGVPAVPPRPESLAAVPNPFRGSTTFQLLVPQGIESRGSSSVEIFSVAGCRVRLLDPGVRPPGDGGVIWDGRDDSGRKVGPGVYWCRVAGLKGGAPLPIQKLE